MVSAAVVLVIGLGGAWLAYGYGLGTLRRPGPGLWPFIVSCLIVVLAVVLMVVGRHLDDAEKFTRSSLLVAVGAATFVALGFLLPVIGFEIPAVLLGIVWLRFLGGESWRSTIVISVLTTAAFYGLFLYALSDPAAPPDRPLSAGKRTPWTSTPSSTASVSSPSPATCSTA